MNFFCNILIYTLAFKPMNPTSLSQAAKINYEYVFILM